MSKSYENLNSIFEIEPTIHAEIVDEDTDSSEVQKFGKDIVSMTAQQRDLENDYNFTRSNLNSLVMKGQELIDGALELANGSESPRAYEVAINGIKSLSEVAEKLIQLHEKMDKITEKVTPVHATQNNFFMNATTSDLIKQLKQSAKEDINKEEERGKS